MSKLDDAITELENRADALKKSVSDARRETEQQVEKRIEHAKAKAHAAQNEVSAAKKEAEDEISGTWTSLKHDMKAHVDALHARIQKAESKADARFAERDAEWAEADALDALSFARWAIENAAVAVLNSIELRVWADAQAEAAPK